MATMNKESCISLRMTKPERRELEQTAALTPMKSTPALSFTPSVIFRKCSAFARPLSNGEI
jgi:hypothetical protein